MAIKSISIDNHKCFSEFGKVEFSRGFNVILGKNNVGKSRLLDALVGQPSGDFHRSVDEIDKRYRLRPNVFTKEFYLNSEDIREAIFSDIGNKYFMKPSFYDFNTMFIRNLHQKDFSFVSAFKETFHSGGYREEFLEEITAANFFGCAVNEMSQSHGGIRLVAGGSAFTVSNDSSGGHELFSLATKRHRAKVFKFNAERFGLSKSHSGTNLYLEQNANNLASCVHYLRSKYERKFDILRKHLAELFPSVLNLLCYNVNNTDVEIFTSSLSPDQDKPEMHISLSACGTGVSQVLAILFVVVAYDDPRVIIIDEPNSFLHPAASKKLIQILKDYPQHQYIISTHSSEVFKAADPETTILLTFEDGHTKAQTIDKSNLDQIRYVLSEVGTSMSDVFAADDVIWVEGKTEEDCFREIAKSIKDFPHGTSILSVRSTGDFEQKDGKQAELVIDVYQKLASGDAIIPPAIGFIFDKENKTPKQVKDLERRFKGKVAFLDFRMYENYLLDVGAITYALRRLDETCKAEDVEEWFESNYKLNKYYDEDFPGDELWQSAVHGAKFLDDLFQALTNTRQVHNKTRDNIKMTQYLIANKKPAFEPIVEKIHDLLSKAKN